MKNKFRASVLFTACRVPEHAYVCVAAGLRLERVCIQHLLVAQVEDVIRAAQGIYVQVCILVLQFVMIPVHAKFVFSDKAQQFSMRPNLVARFQAPHSFTVRVLLHHKTVGSQQHILERFHGSDLRFHALRPDFSADLLAVCRSGSPPQETRVHLDAFTFLALSTCAVNPQAIVRLALRAEHGVAQRVAQTVCVPERVSAANEIAHLMDQVHTSEAQCAHAVAVLQAVDMHFLVNM